ncbi:hypothetical protein F8E02_10680 [Methanoculleus sp. Wushi-C6]|uniref:Uncharacterized protein n=1 Tax=Methanoculleus caldifontis TaxID=2651577 RepID=A0ABU3X337_9EURY|nr:hypothetical protein [Methanoculleus sp. Wushi-C6]MDV2482456.1 hypothetical protein [Methanoculleus sp. Wushi-C6]
MADFVQKTVNKTAVRDLAAPIASVTSFNNLVQSVIDDNPFGCVGYTGAGGEAVAPVVRNREHYTAKVNFVNETTGKRVGTVSLQSPTIAAFNANAAAVMGNAALATAMGGEAERDFARETYYAQLRCHDPSGDDYYVTFTRKTVRISSYQDDTIRTAVETWADAIPALG